MGFDGSTPVRIALAGFGLDSSIEIGASVVVGAHWVVAPADNRAHVRTQCERHAAATASEACADLYVLSVARPTGRQVAATAN